MDIIDIMLARAMTPQGQTETYVNIANAAAAKAEKAEQGAAAAIETVEAAADEIAAAREEAAALLEEAQDTLETAQQAQLNIPDTEDIDAEVKKLNFSAQIGDSSSAKLAQIIANYPDNSSTSTTVVKMYKSSGNNEDGTMTQKAIKSYIENSVNNIVINGGGSSSGPINLGINNEGKIVIVGPDGNITAGNITEEAIIEALISAGAFIARNAVGLEVDYENKTAIRTQEAKTLMMGSDFDPYIMYGGRRRCNVTNDGTITAFYGEDSYREDGSNGQVMVYQPKFYYQRTPLVVGTNQIGSTVIKDSFIISSTPQNGFKVHPIFKNVLGEELDYVLFSAYEGGLFRVNDNTYATNTATNVDFNNDMLSSVSGTKPLTGSSGLSLQRAEQLANNRGTGWHIYNIAAESANQMLEIIEFGSMNGQIALGRGVSDLVTTGNHNQAAISGSTSFLGNLSGVATSTTLENNGNYSVGQEDGKVSISYRGVENPWGNAWQLLNGIIVWGTGLQNGGVPYICTDYNYSYNAVAQNYISAGFSLPNNMGWISSLGYGSKIYDWVLMPAACNDSANSALPIGDGGWYDTNLSGIRAVLQGGGWSFTDNDGPFYYACDKTPSDTSYKSYGARLLFIPTKNDIYTANIEKWQHEMGV